MGKKILHPELQEGLRVQFKDRNEATRHGRIVARQGNKITIETVLKIRERAHIERIIGFWKPKVKASPKNMERL